MAKKRIAVWNRAKDFIHISVNNAFFFSETGPWVYGHTVTCIYASQLLCSSKYLVFWQLLNIQIKHDFNGLE